MKTYKMHACMKLVAVLLTIASVSLGGMQDVYAKGTPQSSSSAKIEVVNVSSKDKLVSTNTTASASKVPTIEVTVDTSYSGAVGGIESSKLVMADVEEAVNVRAEASEKAAIVGKLYKECGGTILEKGNGWTKIKSGNVTGWVRNDFLMFGTEAVNYANKVVEKVATSTTSCLRLRKSPSESAEIYGLLAEGDEITVLEEQGDWVKVEYGDGTICYVSSKYVKIEAEKIASGETTEEIAAREKSEKEEAAKVAAANNSSSKATGATAAPAVPAPTTTAAITGDVNDVTLLAALIQAEAGREIYQGQVAVGNVVINRLNTGRYGNSLMSVIYAKGQFGPAASGQVAQIYAAGPSASCISAAKEAMAGTSYVGTATHFRNVKSGYTGLVIGNHVFW